MTDQELSEIEARAAAILTYPDGDIERALRVRGFGAYNAEFFGASKSTVVALVAEARRLRAAQKLALEALDRGIKSGNEEAVNCYAEDDIREAIAALADPGPR